MVARGWREDELRMTANRYRVSFSGNENVLRLDSVDFCITL